MRKYIIMLSAMLPALTFVSCADDVGEDAAVTDRTAVRVGITLQSRATASVAEGYEAGSEFENYIDVEGGDYRIYFFDGEDRYIAQLETSSFDVADDEGYTSYTVMGEVSPLVVNNADHFKIVILANWGDYDDENLRVGETMISDICETVNPLHSTYEHKTDFELSRSNAMPLFGVREYRNKQFESGKATLLYGEPVSMLRAMAKVEVILQLDEDRAEAETTFTEVRLCRYNDIGYCAPDGVTSQDDYGTWRKDNERRLHLLDGKNDEEYKELPFRKVQEWTEENGLQEKWVIYVPEYDNSGDDYSYITVRLNGQGKANNIYFADYTGGATTNEAANRYDIERNKLYRFKVRVSDGNFEVTTNSWENVWENEFEFGTSLDEVERED